MDLVRSHSNFRNCSVNVQAFTCVPISIYDCNSSTFQKLALIYCKVDFDFQIRGFKDLRLANWLFFQVTFSQDHLQNLKVINKRQFY